MLRWQAVTVRVVGEAFERGIQATEVEPLWVIGEAKMLLQRPAPGGVLALLANPVLELHFAGEL